MKKVLCVAMCIAIMLSLVVETYAVSANEPAETLHITENINDELVSYKGTIEELPDYIEASYNENEKAESIDIYDEDPFSFVTNNTDGTKTVEIFQTPIKYIEDEEIKFIDTKLEELSTFDKLSSEYIYECTKAPVKSFFPTRIKDGISITNEEYEIKCYPNTKNKKLKLKDVFSKSHFSEPTLNEENILTYEDVFDINDIITYTPISNGVKEEIIIEEYNGNNIYEFIIELKDLKPLYLCGDSIPLINKSTGEEVAAISQIDMRDSSQGEAFNTSLFNKIELTQIDGDIYNLKIILDEEFLIAETTVYPVIVDPTVTFNADPIYDAPVFSGYPNKNFNSNTYNVVGYHGSTYGEAISFIKINNIQNYVYIRPENITSAYLKIYESSGKTSTATVGVYNMGTAWNNTTITYNNMPALYAEPYSQKTISASGWHNLDISGFIRNWLRFALNDNGKPQEHGLALKMMSTGVSSRHFCSANNSSYPPSIIINYNEFTALNAGEYIFRSQYNPAQSNWNFLYADTANSNVIQYKSIGNNYQIWNVKYVGSGYYEIYSKGATSNAIGVASATPSNSTNVGLYTSSAGNRIKVRLVKNADNTYRILSVCGNKNKALTVNGPSATSGANIQTSEYSGSLQQRWRVYPSAPCGKLNYWYDDSSKISHQINKNIKVYVTKDSDFNKLETTLKSYVEYAMDAWSDLGYTYTFVDSPSDCNIYVRGISRATAENIDPNSSDAAGFTRTIGVSGTTATYEGVSYSPSGWKEVYSTTKRTVYIIWDSKGDGSTKTSGYNSTVWKTVVTHEIGHALGHEGHTDLNSIMMEELDDILHFEHYKPAAINLSQMQQVY